MVLPGTAQLGLFLVCFEEQACCDVQLCVVTNEGHHTFQRHIIGRYMPDVAAYPICKCTTWAELRGWLEEHHLVHPGGLLRFTCTVSKAL